MVSSILLLIIGMMAGTAIGFQLAQKFNITRKSDTIIHKNIKEKVVQ